jgi:hypothetical protein
MLDMINALLDISRLESGRLPLGLSCPPHAPAGRSRGPGGWRLGAGRNMLISRHPRWPVHTLADGDLIVRVLQDLLGSAEVQRALRRDGPDSRLRLATARKHAPAAGKSATPGSAASCVAGDRAAASALRRKRSGKIFAGLAGR